MRSALLRRSAAAAQFLVMRASTAASAVSLAPDPRSQCERYTDETYAKMRDDERRTHAYRTAIDATAKGRVCLDIGTGALALLALSAARAGASHVYAVEANAAAAAAARDCLLYTSPSPRDQRGSRMPSSA